MHTENSSARRAGVLLHPTSLPGRWGSGDLGKEAYRFVDFLAASGMSVWQILPHGPTHDDGSPYQCLSAHAGNPRWINLEALHEAGWLEHLPAHAATAVDWNQALHTALQGFLHKANSEVHDRFNTFKQVEAHWLDDFALFSVIRAQQQHRSWTSWPSELRARSPQALKRVRKQFDEAVTQVCFEQFIFFSQWHALRQYANARGVQLLGDMPFYVAHDSADVWGQPTQFDLDKTGQPKNVAGVPPDYFSTTGQRWGNPLFDWSAMSRDDYRWWYQRLRTAFNLFDSVRIDHFRGIEAYWSIPATEPTAIGGVWVKGPGEKLLSSLQRQLGNLPVIAEDLGIITPEVTALREQFGLPGMKILQFAFDSGPDNPYLPHQHTRDAVVYTGTHDNDTTLGWYHALSPTQQQHVQDYLGHPTEAMPWPLVRTAFASVAELAVVPWQDLLALGGEHRMNMPGTTQGNWCWRFDWHWVPPELAGRVRHLLHLYGRLQPGVN